MKTGTSRALWFFGIWLAGVLLVTIIGLIVKAILGS